MKIIKSGKAKQEKEHVSKCRNCSCKFSFTRKEARFVADQRDGNAYVVKCPECKWEIWINAEIIR